MPHPEVNIWMVSCWPIILVLSSLMQLQLSVLMMQAILKQTEQIWFCLQDWKMLNMPLCLVSMGLRMMVWWQLSPEAVLISQVLSWQRLSMRMYMRTGQMFPASLWQIRELSRILKRLKQLHIRNCVSFLTWAHLYCMKMLFSRYVKRAFRSISATQISRMIWAHGL